MATDLEPQITLPWLIRLRWLAVIGQLAALGTAHWAFSLELPWLFLLACVTCGAASNVALTAFATRWPARRTMGAVLTFDTVVLTALLAASGGPMNPFTVFYLVYITLSAVVLSARWTTLVGVVSVAGFGLLFLLPGESHHHHHASASLGHHLQGMWLAFTLAAGVTAFFVRRVAQAIARQREEIATLREMSARNARLAAVTTLAAGAAHELGSPLGTIAVAAHDARIAAEGMSGAQGIAEDLQLILLEVDRCQEVLQRMANRLDADGDEGPVDVAELIEGVRSYLGEERAARIEFRMPQAKVPLRLPGAQTIQSIVALVRNALEASPLEAHVLVEVAPSADAVLISVVDQGEGIPESLLGKVGDPFFTTKQTGRGLGLGVFLARAFAESVGGDLLIRSSPGNGTRATLRLPLHSATYVGGLE